MLMPRYLWVMVEHLPLLVVVKMIMPFYSADNLLLRRRRRRRRRMLAVAVVVAMMAVEQQHHHHYRVQIHDGKSDFQKRYPPLRNQWQFHPMDDI